MNRNPIIPFVVIMVFGIGLMFFLSFKGLGDAEQMAKESEEGGHTEEVADASPEELYQQSCIGCHGDQLQGVSGPALTAVGSKLSQEEIQDILVNGTPGGMPGGLVAGNEEKVAQWLAEMK
ncbi:cytochrome c550 [Mesobacillus persicus]|uniref:Cytochrome c550 n=1 Tax=Mesobacillus persicus TaxID=930146 RepID=A0A1H7X6U0_9BACI|nr:cytochrome c [Mesobacillus persicus]SEM29375.1 cytochrome c550 [Mesobacillus persicus]